MAQEDSSRMVDCIKLKETLPGLDKAPFQNEFGQVLFERVSYKAWKMWLKESVRYINTYRWDLSSKQGADKLMEQMKIWFGLEDGKMLDTAWTAPTQAELDEKGACS